MNNSTCLDFVEQQGQLTKESDVFTDLSRAPGFTISRTYQILRANIRKAINSQGVKLTPEETVILIKLYDLDVPIRMGELATELKRDATTITRLLDGLVKKTFVERNQDDHDRRAIRVSLTPYGEETLGSLLPVLNDIRSQAMQGIAEENVAITIDTLLAMQANLEAG